MQHILAPFAKAMCMQHFLAPFAKASLACEVATAIYTLAILPPRTQLQSSWDVLLSDTETHIVGKTESTVCCPRVRLYQLYPQ